MKHKVIYLIFFVLLSGIAHANNHLAIDLHLGEVKVLDVPDVEQVAVGNEEVVLYRPVDNGEFILIGKSVGQSTLHVWQRGGRQKIYRVNVLSQDVSKSLKLARYLTADIPGLNVKERENKLIFTGDITIDQKDNYYSVLAQFQEPISLVTFRSFELQPMVRIDVMLLEIKKRAIKDLGIDWDDATAGPIIGAHKTFSRNDFFGVVNQGPNDPNFLTQEIMDVVPNDYSFYNYGGWTNILGSIINILEEQGDAEILSSPKLMAKSGESASFRSGGEFPIPIVSALGQTEVEFKEYGISLDITPQVDEHGNINTFVFTEVSTIDFANAVNGIPGVITRNSETTVNLRSGETYAISGLAFVERSEQEAKVPLLGDIPYVGRLFKSESTNVDSTEMIVMLTPHLVTPTSAENVRLIREGEKMKDRFSGFNWESSILE